MEYDGYEKAARSLTAEAPPVLNLNITHPKQIHWLVEALI